MDRNHGAAAIGVVAATQNSYGMTGIAPNAQVGVSSDRYGTYATRVDAISLATQKLNAGDILLLEMQQYTFEPFSTACGCPVPGCLVPIDVVESIFAAIQIVVAKGIVVVESAGNGATDLDAPCFAGRFSRAVRDSGAIIVGAGSSLARETLSFSTYGTRVDVQGWGENVATLGYGNLAAVNGAADARQYYTNSFGGTSSATPMVAATAAVVQGVVKNLTGKYLDSKGMRAHLVASGVAQPSSTTRAIGPLPNLKAAIEGLKGRLDIDGDGQYLATTDGLLFLRYFLGLRNGALTNGAVSPAATRTLQQIESYLATLTTLSDVDGDTGTLSATDGLLVMRYLAGFRGAQLIDSVTGTGATRTTASTITDFLLLRTPPLR